MLGAQNFWRQRSFERAVQPKEIGAAAASPTTVTVGPASISLSQEARTENNVRVYRYLLRDVGRSAMCEVERHATINLGQFLSQKSDWVTALSTLLSR